MDVRWRWVVLQAEPGICRDRISERGWEMDAAKLANWENYDQACRSLPVPEGAYVIDTSFVGPAQWPQIAEEVGAWVGGTTTPHPLSPTDRSTPA